MNYQVFLSYSRDDKKVIDGLYKLLVCAFERVKFWLDCQDIEPSAEWQQCIRESISASRLVVVALTRNACLSPHVREEVRLALQAKKRILPIMLEEELTKRAVETALPELARLQCIEGAEIGGLEAVERIIAAVKKGYQEHMTGEVRTFDRVGELVQDISMHKTNSLRTFMIDGGTTLRDLLRNDVVEGLVAGAAGGLDVRCLFVDTDVKDMVGKTVAGRGRLDPGLPASTHRTIFESILQGSLWIHTNGPHEDDLADSIQALTEIRDKYAGRAAVQARLVPALPVNRLILTDNFCYIPAFFPLEDGLRVRKHHYYALRFGGETHIYRVASTYFDHFWNLGRTALGAP